jgi:hypothetical protein
VVHLVDLLLIHSFFINDATTPKPSRMNVVATAKYDAWGKFTGLPKRFAMAKYCEVVQHFVDGGKSVFSNENGDDVQSDDGDVVYDDDNSAVDEDGCPINESGDAFDPMMSAMGVRQSSLMGVENRKVNNMTTSEARLRNAAIHNDVTSLQQAMDNGANLDGSDDSGQTALHFAADRGSIACIKLLLEAGADVNALDNDGIGVLQTAVSAGDVVVVRLLLEAGADPDAKDEDEDSPRSCVLDERDKDMMELFALFPAKE